MSKRLTLFKKYVLIFGALTGCSLLLSGLLNISLAYQENKQSLIRLQREKAEAAAARIGQYLFDIEQRISIITTPKQGTSALDQRCQDIQFLRHIAAISEVYLLDPHGREYFRVSRHATDLLRSDTDFSSSDVFRLPKSGSLYRSPIYFRDGAPLMTVAMAVGPDEAGITVAEVYLEFLLDGITRIKIGNSGHAYAVDASGLLIAHPDIGLVFKKTSLAALPQVQAALKDPTDNNNHEQVQALSLDGNPVLSAFGTIPQLGWFVFVEEPLAEAYRPLYTQAIRSALLVLVGISITLFVCLAVVRRMMKPIHSLQDGAKLIGRGVLDHCITVSTGDELEDLACEFNKMSKQLQISYATLESKVVERTQAIALINEDLAAREVLLQNILDRYRIMFMDSPDPYLIIRDGVFADCNRASEAMLRGDRSLIIGRSPVSLSPEFQPDGKKSSQSAVEKIEEAFRSGSNNFEWVHHRFDGTEFYVEVTIASMLLEGKQSLFISWRDITERKQAEKALEESNYKLEALSITDALTGIANRRRFDEVLNLEYARHARSGAELSLILLDIDYFKAFNDNYGHVAGDDCLRQIGRVIVGCTARPGDLAARYGGEEFACILPETDHVGAVIIAERIRRAIQELAVPHRGSDATNCVTASLGAATTHCQTEGSVTNLVAQADDLLYRAKSLGRNRVESLFFR